MGRIPRAEPINTRGSADLIAGYHLQAVDGTLHVCRPVGTDDWQLIVPLRGRGRIVTAAGPALAADDCAFLWPPRVPNDYGAVDDREGWDYAWVHFLPQPRWRHLLPAARTVRRVALIDPEQRGLFHNRVRELVALVNGNHTRRGERGANALEDVLLRLDECDDERGRNVDPAISRATTAIGEHPQRPWTIAGLARHVGLSRTTFLRRFRAATGTSPRAWQEDARLERAAFLLRDGTLTVAAVAEHLGFCSPFHFSDRFQRRFGRRPGRRTRP